VPKARNVEEIEHGLADLMRDGIEELAEDRIGGRDDQFAGYIILQFGKADARRLILGAAHSYNKYVKNPTVTAPLTALSDEHGLGRAASRCEPRAMFVGARESIRRLFRQRGDRLFSKPAMTISLLGSTAAPTHTIGGSQSSCRHRARLLSIGLWLHHPLS